MTALLTRRWALPGALLMLGLATALALLFGPQERTLGPLVRLVYLHGALVWTALLSLWAAAALGAVALLRQDDRLHHWAWAAWRVGLAFWIAYIPMSMWASSATWNGLFLAEPRWRVAFSFAGIGLVFLIAAAWLRHPPVNSLLAIFYILALTWSLNQANEVMHPSNPIFGAASLNIPLFFLVLSALTVLSAVQFTRWLVPAHDHP